MMGVDPGGNFIESIGGRKKLGLGLGSKKTNFYKKYNKKIMYIKYIKILILK